MTILENYSANATWFPLKWNKEKLPKFVIDNKQNVGNKYWMTDSDSKIEKKLIMFSYTAIPVKLSNRTMQS